MPRDDKFKVDKTCNKIITFFILLKYRNVVALTTVTHTHTHTHTHTFADISSVLIVSVNG